MKRLNAVDMAMGYIFFIKREWYVDIILNHHNYQSLIIKVDCIYVPHYSISTFWLCNHGGYPVNLNVRYVIQHGGRTRSQNSLVYFSIKTAVNKMMYTQFNVAILITMRRPNKSPQFEMRCY